MCYEQCLGSSFEFGHWRIASVDLIKKGKGAIGSQPWHFIDIFPTLASVTGAKVPTECAGVNMTPMFAGKTVNRGPLFWEHEGSRAVRDGKWKVSALYPKGNVLQRRSFGLIVFGLDEAADVVQRATFRSGNHRPMRQMVLALEALSFRNLEEIMAERDLSVDHVTIWRWVQRYLDVPRTMIARPQSAKSPVSRVATAAFWDRHTAAITASN